MAAMEERSPSTSPRVPDKAASERAEPERLQKALARAGLGSRRACEQLVAEGALVAGIDATYIKGIGKFEGRLLILLDLGKVLSENKTEDPAIEN